MKLKQIKNCARCGGDHTDVEAKEFERPFAPPDAIDAYGAQMTWTHWAPCPLNGDPILVMLVG